jgi:mannosyltransferase OCH1-like enzyme
VKNIPARTVIRNANEILPAARIFQYKQRPSYAGFSNFFRYKLLLDRGGWWADSDTICLNAFDFSDEYVFSSEIDYRGVEVVASGIIKVPPNSSIMAYAWKVCENKNPSRLVWGEIGPKLMARAVRKFSLEEYKKGSRVFSPVNYEEWQTVLQPDVGLSLDDNTFAIHLWNEMWRLAGQDKNAQYHEHCLYEKLKSTYLPAAAAGPSFPGLK